MWGLVLSVCRDYSVVIGSIEHRKVGFYIHMLAVVNVQ